MRAYLGRWGRLGRRGERGQAIIETALLLPFIFLLILLSIEFGFMLFTDLTVEAAAHEAARAAAVGAAPGTTATPPSDCGGASTIRGRAVQASAGRVRCDEVSIYNVERSAPGTSASPLIGSGDGVVVDIQHKYSPFTPGLAILDADDADGTVTLRGCVDARIEQPTAGIPVATPAAGKTSICP